MATLWADVPPERRTRFAYASPYGRPPDWTPECPYAVPATATSRHIPARGEMRQCRGLIKPGATACASHDPLHPPRSSQAGYLRNVVRWIMPRPRPADQLGWFRALTDEAILARRMVGTKTSATIREARDSWDDERVMAFFGFEPQRSRDAPDDTWPTRPDV